MSRFFNFLDAFLKCMAQICIGGMLVLVFAQVVTRYGFGYTPTFSEELSRYLFVWTVFLCLPLLAKTGGHMAIETLTSHLQGKALKTVRIIADIFTTSFLIIMVCQGCKMVSLQHFQTSPAMVIPMSYVYCIIPFGCFVMLIYTLQDLFTLFKTPASEMHKKEG